MGLLITIEGGEYVGKTSLVAPAIKKIFEDAGVEAILSREPGGTAEGEKMRKYIFHRLEEGASALELTVLFNQARQIHLQQLIIPFLGKNKEENRVVVLDRYLDTTRVYQHLQAGVPLEKIKELENKYVKNYLPDLTFILYFSEEKFEQVFAQRKNYADHYDRKNPRPATAFDKQELSKHLERQRLYFKLPEIAKKFNEKRTFKFIDSSISPNEVIETCLKYCSDIVNSSKKILILPTKSLQSAFDNLVKKGEWKKMQTLWEKQNTPKI